MQVRNTLLNPSRALYRRSGDFAGQYPCRHGLLRFPLRPAAAMSCTG